MTNPRLKVGDSIIAKFDITDEIKGELHTIKKGETQVIDEIIADAMIAMNDVTYDEIFKRMQRYYDIIIS